MAIRGNWGAWSGLLGGDVPLEEASIGNGMISGTRDE
jgi:hypothetical protein